MRVLRHDNLKPHLDIYIPEWTEAPRGRLRSADQLIPTSPQCTKAQGAERQAEQPVVMDTTQGNGTDINSDPSQGAHISKSEKGSSQSACGSLTNVPHG